MWFNDSKKTPQDEQAHKLAMGAAASQSTTPPKLNELAEITAYHADTNSYDVVTQGNQNNPAGQGPQTLKDIPRKTAEFSDYSALPEGCTVVINWDLGPQLPYIDGVLPMDLTREAADAYPTSHLSVTGSPNPTSMDTSDRGRTAQGFYRRADSPADLYAGDCLQKAPDGAYLGLLQGKYVILSAGPAYKAKLELFGDRHAAAITSENLRINTSFGFVEFLNAEGRCGIKVRGGVDQLTESGGDEGNWTFKLDIGDDGGYYAMEICEAGGKTKAKLHISNDGHITWTTADGFDIVSGGDTPSHLELASSYIVKILGDVSELVEKSKYETIHGSRSTQISETDDKVVGGNNSVNVNSSETRSIGGNLSTRVVGGPFREANPLNVATEHQILNGGYHLEVGNPLLGANPLAKAGINLLVNNGDVTLGANPSILAPPPLISNVNLNTRLPNSVALGGTVSPLSGNPALFHAVKYEPLAAILTGMMAMFDTHIHIGPLPPALTLTGAGMTPILSPQLLNAMSLRVVIGM